MNRKIAALVLALILVVNLVLIAMGIISSLVFWTVVIGIGLLAYFGFGKRNINKSRRI